MGFQDDIDTILQKTPEDKQTVLFSATMSKAILSITHKYQDNPEHIKVAHKQVTVPGIAQYYLEVRDASKLDVLSRVIDGHNIGVAIVFCNTKRKVDALTMGLRARGYLAEAIHGDIRQNERTAVMTRFKNGDINILVATDVAARGIDVENIEAVFNYDLPNDEEYYVHRIGRTGRAGKEGAAYTFVSGREYGKIKEIQRFTKAKMTLVKPPTKFDIEESRMAELLKNVAAQAGEGGNDAFATYVEQVVDELNTGNTDRPDMTTLDVAAALLKMLSQKTAERATEVPATQKPRQQEVYQPRAHSRANRGHRDRRYAHR
jgi:ATP-dependent RNA helicase DeaD